MAERQQTAEEMALELRQIAERLVAADRKDLLLRAIGVPLLEELRIEAARVLVRHPSWPTSPRRWGC